MRLGCKSCTAISRWGRGRCERHPDGRLKKRTGFGSHPGGRKPKPDAAGTCALRVPSAVTYSRLSLRIRLPYKRRQHGLFHHSGDFVQAFQGGYVRSSDTRERQGYKSKESGKQRNQALLPKRALQLLLESAYFYERNIRIRLVEGVANFIHDCCWIAGSHIHEHGLVISTALVESAVNSRCILFSH